MVTSRLLLSELMGGSLPLAYYNALQEERGEPGPGTECVTSEPVPRVMVTRLHGWCLPRRMEGGKENKVMLIRVLSRYYYPYCQAQGQGQLLVNS